MTQAAYSACQKFIGALLMVCDKTMLPIQIISGKPLPDLANFIKDDKDFRAWVSEETSNISLIDSKMVFTLLKVQTNKTGFKSLISWIIKRSTLKAVMVSDDGDEKKARIERFDVRYKYDNGISSAIIKKL